jgi:hypothetical protein
MSTTTYEGKVINGRIELPANAILPENSRVLVLVLDGAEPALGRIASPRLANQEQAVDFVMQVEEASDASL